MNSFDADTSVERSVENRWRRPPSEPGTPIAVEEDTTSRMQRTWLVGGRYELSDEISSGGMGRVFRAVHRDLGRSFALKLLLEGQRQRQDSRERFFVEARLASALCHPNIVSVTDYGIDEQYGCFLVMEMLEGATVRARMQEGRVPPRLAFDVIDQLTGAVRYMHGRGIIHADIKPENVFLTLQEGEPRRRNIVKLLDFGLSFRSNSAPDQKVSGTPPYIAPERLQGVLPSPGSDVYSLGALLYELLTGHPIYTGTTAEMLEKSIRGPLPAPPSSYAPGGLNSRIDALVMRAIEPDPSRRHPTAEAFHFELRTVMSMTGLRLRKREARPQARPVEADARAAMEAALQAASVGDLASVQRILLGACDRLDTFGALRPVVEEASKHIALDTHDGVEDA